MDHTWDLGPGLGAQPAGEETEAEGRGSGGGPPAFGRAPRQGSPAELAPAPSSTCFLLPFPLHWLPGVSAPWVLRDLSFGVLRWCN